MIAFERNFSKEAPWARRTWGKNEEGYILTDIQTELPSNTCIRYRGTISERNPRGAVTCQPPANGLMTALE
jgi:hypothetical protein